MTNFIKNNKILLIFILLIVVISIFGWIFLRTIFFTNTQENVVKSPPPLTETEIQRNTQPVGDIAAIKIIQEKHLKTPDFAYFMNYQGDQYIVACIDNLSSVVVGACNQFVFLKKGDDTWAEEDFTKPSESYYKFDSVQIISIGQEPLMYYKSVDWGASVAVVTAGIFSIKDKKFYFVDYTTTDPNQHNIQPSQLEISDGLAGRPNLLRFLQGK